MNIKEEIIHYIDVDNGSEKRIIEDIVSDPMYEFGTDAEPVESNIYWLLEHKYIESVPCPQMTGMQKDYYDSDGRTFYRIIKRYNESEYLKEQYGSNN